MAITDRPSIADDLAAGPLPALSSTFVDRVIAEDLMTDGAAAALLASLLERPAWMADALCREYPELNFHPERGQPTAPLKAVCARCVVRSECLAYANEHEPGGNLRHGIWGGQSAKGRRASASNSADDVSAERPVALTSIAGSRFGPDGVASLTRRDSLADGGRAARWPERRGDDARQRRTDP